jgi:hypothetical protein
MKIPDYIPAAVRAEATKTPALKYPAERQIIERIINDPRMRLVWEELLPKITTQESKQRGFFNEAWSSFENFGLYREEEREVESQHKKIVNATNRLVELLEEFPKITVVETELLSIKVLLCCTTEGQQLFDLWTDGRSVPNSKFSPGDPPDLIHLLSTFRRELNRPLRKGQKSHEPRLPRHPENIRYATESRKKGLPYAYLRNFWIRLREFHEFEPSMALANALGVTAEVVLEGCPDKVPEATNIYTILLEQASL